MRYEDWRLATPAEVAPLLAAEAERWASGLDWDIGPSLVQAERGRRNGRIPGFIARGASGASTGFTFFSVDRGVLNLGILAGERADVVRELLDLVLESPEAAFARRYQGFLFPRSGTVAVALTRRRFVLAPQCFLARPTATPLPCPAPAGRPWAEDDLANVVRLFARAYAGTPAAQAFAPEGRVEEWVAYLGQLTRTPACGVFLPEASVVVDGDRPDRLAGVVLVTRTARAVWHVAQVAVDPARRGMGMGRHLVAGVCAAAAAAGAAQVTLVVDERNAVARSLYASLGFGDRATLVFGSRPRLTRVLEREPTGLVAPGV